jgi:hypothetical protein
MNPDADLDPDADHSIFIIANKKPDLKKVFLHITF